jgi:hypothetical protein
MLEGLVFAYCFLVLMLIQLLSFYTLDVDSVADILEPTLEISETMPASAA